MKKIFKNGILTVAMVSLLTTAASAEDKIAGSKVGTGLVNLFNDLSNYMLVIGPLVAGVAGGYYIIRRSMANEQDGFSWNKRLTVAVSCGVGIFVIGGIIKLIASYFI